MLAMITLRIMIVKRGRMYHRRYKLENIVEDLEEIFKTGKTNIDVEDLLFGIGFDMRDLNSFFTKHIKHRLRYEKDYSLKYKV